MTTSETDHATQLREAEERLLDALLEDATATAATRRRTEASPTVARLLVAAMLLLGCGVVLAIVVTTRLPPEAVGSQDPDLPEAVSVRGADELAALDPATQNVCYTALDPDELAGLGRLSELRAFELVVEDGGQHGTEVDEAAWREAGAGVLDPLRACRELRSVTLRYAPGFDHAALCTLGDLPQLRTIVLSGTTHVVDAHVAAAWSKLALVRVELLAVRVTADGFAGLCELPVLRELELDACLHLGRCDLTRLGRLRQLRELALRSVGGRFPASLELGSPLPGEVAPPVELAGPVLQEPEVLHTGLPSGGPGSLLLQPPVMRAIAGLPELRVLDLTSAVVDDRAIAGLPAGLHVLDLRTVVGLTPVAIASLARLEQLRELRVSLLEVAAPPEGIAVAPEDLAEAFQAVLPRLALETLDIRGPADESWARAAARCESLRRIVVDDAEVAAVLSPALQGGDVVLEIR